MYGGDANSNAANICKLLCILRGRLIPCHGHRVRYHCGEMDVIRVEMMIETTLHEKSSYNETHTKVSEYIFSLLFLLRSSDEPMEAYVYFSKLMINAYHIWNYRLNFFFFLRRISAA